MKRIVNDELHKISKAIVQEAVETNSVIILGKLKRIRKNHKERILNCKLNSFPYYKLASYIEYSS